MAKIVTLKLSPQLKARIAREARQRGKSLDNWVLDAVERELERRDRFISYVRRAQQAGSTNDPLAEIDARQQLRYFLDRLSATQPGTHSMRLPPRLTRVR